jgi:hypothetical protein
MSVILLPSKPAATAADRGTGRIATRTYQVTLPTGTATATIPQGYWAAEGGGEIARLRRLFPTMTAAAMVA